MFRTYTTHPIPIFPTAGAEPATRTPMARVLEKASMEAVNYGYNGALGLDQIKEIAATMVADHLDGYARDIEIAAMEVATRDTRCGLVAVWHSADYTILATTSVQPGYLVERRCGCNRTPTELN